MVVSDASGQPGGGGAAGFGPGGRGRLPSSSGLRQSLGGGPGVQARPQHHRGLCLAQLCHGTTGFASEYIIDAQRME
eukprot:scaffold42818_cov34-Prasinocladus_malaysianus.AAC.1